MIPDGVKTVVAQLGGPRIFSMAFASSVYSVRGADRPPSKGPLGVSFAIATGLRRAVNATHVVVDLEDNDTYTVSVWRQNSGIGFHETLVKRQELVHADSLRRVVEDMTGLRLSL